MRLFFLLVGVVFSFHSSFASEIDTGPFKFAMPDKAIDSQLTGNSPRDFFAKRIDNPVCRPKLEKARAAYDLTKKALADEKAKTPAGASDEQKDKLDGIQKQVISARDAWVNLFSECGPCTSREPEPIITDDEAWYGSYGSCQLSETNKDKLKGYFDTWKDSLLHVKKYANKDGGFYYILDLLLNDVSGVPFASTFDAISDKAVEGALSVRGPKIIVSTGFTFYTKQLIDIADTEGAPRFFAMQGWPVKELPPKFKYPPIEDYLASGKKVKLAQQRLSHVISQWYFNDDGYVSYFMAGDFSRELSAVQKQAKVIMQDTMANMAERVEANPK